MTSVDLKLERPVDTKIYDLTIASSGDLGTIESFDTSLAVSLFAEKRADSSEVPDPPRRRGWWGNETNDEIEFEIGSKLWILMAQPRKTSLNLERAKSYAREALQWLIDDGFLQSLEVSAEFTSIGIRLTIVLYRSANIVETKYYDLWEASGELVT
jgi:phage gp46-like protein